MFPFAEGIKDEYCGIGACHERGCPMCWPDHECDMRVPSSLTDSVKRLVASIPDVPSRLDVYFLPGPSRFDVYFLAEKMIQMIQYSHQIWFMFWNSGAVDRLERLTEFCRNICYTLKLEMSVEFCRLLGLPDLVSNEILDMLLEDAINDDNAALVRFEESPIKNDVTRVILTDVFNYLVRSWTDLVERIESSPCYCAYPYLRGLKEFQVPDDKMEDWRNYFGLPQELEWFSMFDEEQTEATGVADVEKQIEELNLEEDRKKPNDSKEE